MKAPAMIRERPNPLATINSNEWVSRWIGTKKTTTKIASNINKS